MKRTSRFALALALLAGAPVFAASRSAGDLLSLVPADAASVAVVRLSDLRESPLAAKLFANADRMTVDGDAARFLEEAQLNPKKDVDVVVVASRPGAGAPALAVFEGRFDTERLAGAAVGRGAVKKTTPAGDYYLLPEKHSAENGRPAAVAFVSPSLVIAGSEGTVAQALADRQAGGSGFASGSGLGRELRRVDRSASVWAIMDINAYPAVAKQRARIHVSEDDNQPAVAMLGAMKSVSIVAVQATTRGDGLEISASGVARDAESRQLLEDSLRGLMAMWRLAVEDKSPELVSVLRKFSVSSEGDAVSIHGTLSGSAIRALSTKKHRAP